jgi:hypothetical protein
MRSGHEHPIGIALRIEVLEINRAAHQYQRASSELDVSRVAAGAMGGRALVETGERQQAFDSDAWLAAFVAAPPGNLEGLARTTFDIMQRSAAQLTACAKARDQHGAVWIICARGALSVPSGVGGAYWTVGPAPRGERRHDDWSSAHRGTAPKCVLAVLSDMVSSPGP